MGSLFASSAVATDFDFPRGPVIKFNFPLNDRPFYVLFCDRSLFFNVASASRMTSNPPNCPFTLFTWPTSFSPSCKRFFFHCRCDFHYLALLPTNERNLVDDANFTKSGTETEYVHVSHSTCMFAGITINKSVLP